jgi:hypothetical protein
MVMVTLHMDDAAKSKAFIALADLKGSMKKMGVSGASTISYVDV